MNINRHYMSFKISSLNNNYHIYNDGRVYSTLSTRFLKPFICCGYYTVILQDKSHLIHRLVALEFVANPDPEKNIMVNHIDHNKLNNDYTNLEWVTASKNSQESAKFNGPATTQAVLQYSMDNQLIAEYCSLIEAERKTGTSSEMIRQCCLGHCNAARDKNDVKYFWQYKIPRPKEELPEDGKEIKDFENYLITPQGKIYSKFLKRYNSLKKNNNGYLQATLSNGGTKKSFSVNRLVATYFLPEPSEYQTEVNHIDHDRANNNANNLEWCTHSENIQHSAFKRYKKVQLTEIATGKITIFDSLVSAAKYLKDSRSHITECCKGMGIRKTVKGHKCIYLEENNVVSEESFDEEIRENNELEELIQE